MQRSNTELVTWFSKMRQELELNEEKEKVSKVGSSIAKRRAKLVSQGKIPEAEGKTLNKSVADAEKFKLIDDHRISLEELVGRFKTDLVRGLSQEEADLRLQRDGENKLSEKEGINPILEYFLFMANFFTILMWIGTVLCFIAFGISSSDPSNLYLGIVLVVVINVSTIIEYTQHHKSRALMESFKNFSPSEITVVRDGVERRVAATKLVCGDIVLVKFGEKVPADLRILQSNGLKVDNSSLTGETELLSRTAECTRPDNPLETKNIAFFSTLVREGSGRAIVIFTGDRTFIGQIAGLALSAEAEETTLGKEINRFVRALGTSAICFGIIVFCVGLGIGFPPINALSLAIGITVANVPSGLLLEITIALTCTARRLSKKRVLAKNLKSVETLGSCSCICSDKTGTLTMNRMIAAHLWYSLRTSKATNLQTKKREDVIEYDVKDPGFIALQECASVCSVAIFDPSPPAAEIERISSLKSLSETEKAEEIKSYIAEWSKRLETMSWLDMPTIGDASESALIKFFQPIQDVKSIRQKYPVIVNKEGREVVLLFSSINKFAFSINRYAKGDSALCLFTKGAPERVWAMCTHILVNGVRRLITDEERQRFKEANLYFGKQGERVLGFAMLHLPPAFTDSYDFTIDNVETPNFPLREQTFVGVVSLNDPPRDSVPFSVIKAHTAGVKVIMVTGDQPVTAAAIARECNIISEKETVNEAAERLGISFEEAFSMSEAIVIHGDEITKMSLEDEGLPEKEQGKKMDRWLSKKEIVFARTSPAQKLIIVSACQRAGEIVAVTGDGVNDAPAIKKADVGISMGITGTEVAKDAAAMVLLDDDFSSIITGIEEGRKIFDNLKKAIIYVACSQTTEIAPFVLLLVIQIPPPVSAVMVLCIDLGTDLIPAVSYAYEDAELAIMTRRPRSLEDHLVTFKLFAQGYGQFGFTNFSTCLLSYFIVASDFGFPPPQLPFTNGISLLQHGPADVYNPNSPFFGNSNLAAVTSCSDFSSKAVLVDWLYSQQASQDLRMSAVRCTQNGAAVAFTQVFAFSECRVQQISPMTNRPVCFSTEAIKYAQSSYFFTNVIMQMTNNLMFKTRKESVFTQGLRNMNTFFGISTELLLIIAQAYTQFLNVIFGTRDLMFLHFGVSAWPIAIITLMIEEARKYLLRTLPFNTKISKPNWFERVTLW